MFIPIVPLRHTPVHKLHKTSNSSFQLRLIVVIIYIYIFDICGSLFNIISFFPIHLLTKFPMSIFSMEVITKLFFPPADI